MGGRLTVWGAGELLTTFFGNDQAAKEPPGSFWLALVCTIAPTPYMSGAELDEPQASDYGRVEIPNDGFNWGNTSQPQTVANLLDTLFVQAVTDWGVCNYWALCNAPSEGMNYIVGDLESPIQVLAGDTVQISDGDLGISLGPFFLADDEDAD